MNGHIIGHIDVIGGSRQFRDQEGKDDQEGDEHHEPETEDFTVQELDILIIVPLHVHDERAPFFIVWLALI
jgi:hypothetical protein